MSDALPEDLLRAAREPLTLLVGSLRDHLRREISREVGCKLERLERENRLLHRLLQRHLGQETYEDSLAALEIDPLAFSESARARPSTAPAVRSAAERDRAEAGDGDTSSHSAGADGVDEIFSRPPPSPFPPPSSAQRELNKSGVGAHVEEEEEEEEEVANAGSQGDRAPVGVRRDDFSAEEEPPAEQRGRSSPEFSESLEGRQETERDEVSPEGGGRNRERGDAGRGSTRRESLEIPSTFVSQQYPCDSLDPTSDALPSLSDDALQSLHESLFVSLGASTPPRSSAFPEEEKEHHEAEQREEEEEGGRWTGGKKGRRARRRSGSVQRQSECGVARAFSSGNGTETGTQVEKKIVLESPSISHDLFNPHVSPPPQGARRSFSRSMDPPFRTQQTTGSPPPTVKKRRRSSTHSPYQRKTGDGGTNDLTQRRRISSGDGKIRVDEERDSAKDQPSSPTREESRQPPTLQSPSRSGRPILPPPPPSSSSTSPANSNSSSTSPLALAEFISSARTQHVQEKNRSPRDSRGTRTETQRKNQGERGAAGSLEVKQATRGEGGLSSHPSRPLSTLERLQMLRSSSRLFPEGQHQRDGRKTPQGKGEVDMEVDGRGERGGGRDRTSLSARRGGSLKGKGEKGKRQHSMSRKGKENCLRLSSISLSSSISDVSLQSLSAPVSGSQTGRDVKERESGSSKEAKKKEKKQKKTEKQKSEEERDEAAGLVEIEEEIRGSGRRGVLSTEVCWVSEQEEEGRAEGGVLDADGEIENNAARPAAGELKETGREGREAPKTLRALPARNTIQASGARQKGQKGPLSLKDSSRKQTGKGGGAADWLISGRAMKAKQQKVQKRQQQCMSAFIARPTGRGKGTVAVQMSRRGGTQRSNLQGGPKGAIDLRLPSRLRAGTADASPLVSGDSHGAPQGTRPPTASAHVNADTAPKTDSGVTATAAGGGGVGGGIRLPQRPPHPVLLAGSSSSPSLSSGKALHGKGKGKKRKRGDAGSSRDFLGDIQSLTEHEGGRESLDSVRRQRKGIRREERENQDPRVDESRQNCTEHQTCEESEGQERRKKVSLSKRKAKEGEGDRSPASVSASVRILSPPGDPPPPSSSVREREEHERTDAFPLQPRVVPQRLARALRERGGGKDCSAGVLTDTLERLENKREGAQMFEGGCSHHCGQEEGAKCCHGEARGADVPAAAAAAGGGGAVPWPHYRVVRNKEERAKLMGVDCTQCADFYDAIGEVGCAGGCTHGGPRGGGEPAGGGGAADLKQNFSRHRFLQAPTETPAGFWKVGFSPSQATASGTQQGQGRGRASETQFDEDKKNCPADAHMNLLRVGGPSGGVSRGRRERRRGSVSKLSDLGENQKGGGKEVEHVPPEAHRRAQGISSSSSSSSSGRPLSRNADTQKTAARTDGKEKTPGGIEEECSVVTAPSFMYP
uniref:DNA endonuclease activator Ctp1 C-terminal domain-containing protein n=1 Tax=Chromera velia CCMP2878 TaxID=1169474 RepID=A0A0G4FL11_9ALVE|eukprot:Cvel_17503.t1-p1 / transcript=Cvel_17503.t1 / gene=Cvel_17503 / organism=Chromera_velia_CCMP2878 / gene_product=hypothetical protein / transcript_product=hypothetical protein / location=Cvel_scaffold1401:36764-42454(-) / protein_length=1428 / sequence_SO=supercontig / SO=protein_coding / is_pseudo=false